MNWRLAFLLLFAFVAGITTHSCATHKRAVESQVALQNSILQYTASTVAAQKAEAQRVIDMLAKPDPVREAQNRAILSVIKEVQDAPNTDRCVSSPAVMLALDRLRQLTPATAGGQQHNPAP